MPELFVMRHAKSDWDNALPDFDRPLAERGHRNAVQMAEWLDAQGHVPKAILSSAANRARTTARYIADHFGLSDEVIDERRALYFARAQDWLEALREQTVERLLVCGHNPGLDDLVEELTSGPVELTDDGKLMTTAAIAVFTVQDWATIGDGEVELRRIARPRELE